MSTRHRIAGTQGFARGGTLVVVAALAATSVAAGHEPAVTREVVIGTDLDWVNSSGGPTVLVAGPCYPANSPWIAEGTVSPARWIWDNSCSDAWTRTFSTTVTVDPGLLGAVLEFATDNTGSASIDGTHVKDSLDEFRSLTTADVTDDLRTVGDHTLAVTAVNVGGPGGVLARLTLTYADTPRSRIASVLSGLGGVAAEGKPAGKVDKAVDRLTEALDDERWADDSTLDEKHGKKVFDELGKAVKELDKALGEDEKHGGLDAEARDVLTAAVDELLAVAELLATGAIAAASDAIGAAPGSADDHELAKADEKLAKAQHEVGQAHDQLAAGNHLGAMGHFEKAWDEAGKALEKVDKAIDKGA